MPHDPALPLDDIRRCAVDPAFLAAADSLFADLDARVAARSPVCLNRGTCCSFDRFGHLLFVTGAELAYFLAKTAGPVHCPSGPDTCPCRREGRCTARSGRPAGCRIFFCDPISRPWQPPLSETTLARLKELHGPYRLPYVYVEWMAALRLLAGV